MLPVSLPVCNMTCYYVFGVVIITRLITSVNIYFRFLFFFYESPGKTCFFFSAAAVRPSTVSFFLWKPAPGYFFQRFLPLQIPPCILIFHLLYSGYILGPVSSVFRPRQYPESSLFYMGYILGQSMVILDLLLHLETADSLFRILSTPAEYIFSFFSVSRIQISFKQDTLYE